MSYNYNADNIFEMAEEIEKNGSQFYREAARKTDDALFRKLLADLAEMEVHHGKRFAEMRKQLIKEEKEPTAFDPGGEETAYLRSLADTKVFFRKTIDYSSRSDILHTAIEAEKDSILFYLGMKSFVPESMGKSWLDDIINEEKKHIVVLSGWLGK